MFVMLRQWNDIWRGFYRLCWRCALRLKQTLDAQLVVQVAP